MFKKKFVSSISEEDCCHLEIDYSRWNYDDDDA